MLKQYCISKDIESIKEYYYSAVHCAKTYLTELQFLRREETDFDDVDDDDFPKDSDDETDDEDFDDDKFIEESYRTTFETDPEDLDIQAEDITDDGF